MKDSMYLSRYQSLALSYLADGKRPLTLNSFLAYRLRGKAKRYGAGYKRALENALTRHGWLKGPSFGGRTAYYPPLPFRVTPVHLQLSGPSNAVRICVAPSK